MEFKQRLYFEAGAIEVCICNEQGQITFLLTSTESATLPILVDELSWEIEQFTIANSQFSDTSQTSTSLSSDLPLILFVDLDPSLTDPLSVSASAIGWRDCNLNHADATQPPHPKFDNLANWLKLATSLNK
jgi:hypothetical protein